MAGNGPLCPSHGNSCVQPRQQAIPEVLKTQNLLQFEAVRVRAVTAVCRDVSTCH